MFWRKEENLETLKAHTKDYDNQKRYEEFNVVKEVKLSKEEFDAFASDFFEDHRFLAGKGGFEKDVRQCVSVSTPNRPTVLVDPSGYSYARYTALL